MSVTAIKIPVGTIVAYAADPSNLPKNWVVCDGSSYSITGFPDLYKAIGTSNGGGGDVLNIPDLRGRFIRGDSTSLSPGFTHPDRTASPNNSILMSIDTVATEKKYSLKIAGPEYIAWNDNSTDFSVTGGDAETRPINTYMHYIIKVQEPTYSNSKGKVFGDVPLAGVFPFGGNDSQYPSSFPASIRCDGSSVDIAKVQELFQVLQTKWSSDPSPNPSVLIAPDITGRFVRGIDPISKYDPDAGSREPAPDGSRQGLGTWQKYATAISSSVKVSIQHFSTFSRTSDHVAGYDSIADESYSSGHSFSGGDKESRPLNAAVHFYINSIAPDKLAQVFPIGGIIAIPGTPGTYIDESIWVPCDGKPYNRRIYASLFSVIGTTWGYDDDQDFFVPNFESQYLRGADPKGRQDGGDPDRDSRFAGATNGTGKGAGSFQKAATGMPHNALSVTISYPGPHNQTSLASDFWTNDTAGSPAKGSFALTSWPDGETAPRTVVVKYYMRAF